MRKLTILPPLIALTLMAIGCGDNENTRLAKMAEENLIRQDAQNQRMADLQQEVAEGSRRLVEADAEARQEIIGLQRDVQAERAEVGVQRDSLEAERRDIANHRYWAPIIAVAIGRFGLLIGCLLPLILCWHLLQRRVEPADDAMVAEVLLEDLVIDDPLLIPRMPSQPAIAFEDADDPVGNVEPV
jgi:hypothetical protein